MALKLITLADLTLLAAGTRQQVSIVNQACTTIVFTAKKANTGKIYIGDSNVSATRGIELEAGETMAVSADMGGRAGADEFILSDFWFDGGTSADVLGVAYVKQSR